MISNVYFSYTESEGEAYSYLKYFFRSAGIWTQDEDKSQNDTIQIHILDGESMVQMGPERKDCYYLARKNSSTQTCFRRERNDLLELKWKKRRLVCSELFDKIVPKQKEKDILLNLLQIFDDAEAWGTYWIFHEISNGENEEINRYIIDVCKKISKSIEESTQKSWNHKYMALYCDYMLCKTRNHVSESRTEECTMLLEKCAELVKEKERRNASIY